MQLMLDEPCLIRYRSRFESFLYAPRDPMTYYEMTFPRILNSPNNTFAISFNTVATVFPISNYN